MPPPSPAGPSPDSLFATWLSRYEAGEEADLEALCRAHPEVASELRELHGHWARVEAVRRQHGLGGSLAQRLKTQYGTGVDPQVTLEGEEQARADFSAEVLSRLEGRGPASTRYRIKGEVAHGGMGAVLRVWDEDLRRHLAMKVMLGRGIVPERGDTPRVDPRSLGRFLEEAQVTGQLDHPGIVPVHELGLDADGRVFFTMKLVRGKTLKEVFDELANGRGGWTSTRVLGLILKVCEAMSYAHAKGVIHRDLKPANVMVGRYGEVYVMDWGLAKVVGREDDKDLRIRADPGLTTTEVRSERRDYAAQTPDSPLFTMDGDVVGTPAYMSPEQARGELGSMGPHSDVYAVGALLYHLLAGHMPYVPPDARLNNYAVWQRVQEGPPRPLHELAPGAPAELVAICERAMERAPQRRYRDMAALSEDLSAYVEGRVVGAYETGAWAEARKWVQRNKPLASSLAAAVLLLVVGLVSSLLLKAQSDANALEAQRNLSLAQQNEAEAQAQRDIARAQTDKVLRLSDVKVLQEMEAEADRLWPAYPGNIPMLRSWLERAHGLVDNLEDHRATLLEMRARAHPWSSEERARDRATHPRAADLAERRTELEALIARLDEGLTGEERERAETRVATLEAEVETLSAQVEARRTWSFELPEDQWQHDVLTELVGNLEGLMSGLLAEDTTTPDHGWSVPKRLVFAQELQAGFEAGGTWAEAWSQALPAMREAYPGLELEAQIGLVPLGPDPDSGLWEFAHLMSGEPARRDAAGELVLTDATGLVLVLLPGGTFWMGAQPDDPAGTNYDPQAQEDEGPVHEVELSAFFLSKYELTQAQWLALRGQNPSYYHLDNLASSLLHPVEQVSWEDFVTWLERFGLTLPSEAQWEYGTRAGTSTPWWTGDDRESLRERGAVNLADQAAARAGAPWAEIEDWPELDDGHAIHAPVGTFTANPFGLHEVTGNLWEWCLDGYDPAFYARSPRKDPLERALGAVPRICRGGSFHDSAFLARVSPRYYISPSYTNRNLGARPARALEIR